VLCLHLVVFPHLHQGNIAVASFPILLVKWNICNFQSTHKCIIVIFFSLTQPLRSTHYTVYRRNMNLQHRALYWHDSPPNPTYLVLQRMVLRPYVSAVSVWMNLKQANTHLFCCHAWLFIRDGRNKLANTLPLAEQAASLYPSSVHSQNSCCK